ncbi:hypothetical protein BD0047_03860 [Helicobacter pylori]
MRCLWNNKKYNHTKNMEYNINSMVKQPYDEFNIFYKDDDKAPFERFIRRIKIKTLQK